MKVHRENSNLVSTFDDRTIINTTSKSLKCNQIKINTPTKIISFNL
ncbi:hypothetical protein [Pectinatus frisingensis]|nr:hypothetical protein [Pectinatus frisingensis]